MGLSVRTEALGLVSGTMPENVRAEQDEIRSVVLMQPHRLGRDDPRLGDALGQYVDSYRLVSGGGLRPECYDAGRRYAELVQEARNAMGLGSPGFRPGSNDFVPLTDDQLRARRDLAERRLGEANDLLRGLFGGSSRPVYAVRRVAYEGLEPFPRDEDLLAHCLYRLGIHFGMIRPFHRGES